MFPTWVEFESFTHFPRVCIPLSPRQGTGAGYRASIWNPSTGEPGVTNADAAEARLGMEVSEAGWVGSDGDWMASVSSGWLLSRGNAGLCGQVRLSQEKPEIQISM